MSRTMSAEVEVRWQRTVERWRRDTPRMPQPLRFEVPPEKKADVADFINFGEAFIDTERFYAENRGGARNKLILAYTIAGGFGLTGILVTFIAPTATNFWVPNWLLTLLLLALAYWAWHAEKSVTRSSTIVFERETGKVYVPVDDNTPHVALGFYDQYFYITDGQVDINRHGALHLFLPNVQLDDGRELGGFSIRLAFVGDKDDAEASWRFLVRYMDRDWPFTKDELDIFEYVKEEKEKAGYKVEDVRRIPGERTFF